MNQSWSVRRSRSDSVGLSTRVPEDMADAGGVGTERRRHAGRQRFRDEAHALEHARAREVQIDVVLEDDVDHREPERRLRADDAHAGEPLQVHGQRIGDLVLDLLRAVARPVGEDDHLVVREIGNRIDRRGAERPPAPRRPAPRTSAITMKRLRSDSSMSRLIMTDTRPALATHRRTPRPTRTPSG